MHRVPAVQIKDYASNNLHRRGFEENPDLQKSSSASTMLGRKHPESRVPVRHNLIVIQEGDVLQNRQERQTQTLDPTVGDRLPMDVNIWRCLSVRVHQAHTLLLDEELRATILEKVDDRLDTGTHHLCHLVHEAAVARRLHDVPLKEVGAGDL